jgi:ferric-dicitrate binding protein FerR (iron transport regulator)
MNLTDAEILELNDLCNAVVDGTLNEAQRGRLSQWLTQSEEARKFYVRAVGLSASLFHYSSEMQAEAPDARGAPASFPGWWFWGAAAVAAAATVLLVPVLRTRGSAGAVPPREFVACLTGSSQTQWAAGAPALQPGDHLRQGQRLELASGFAEVTFDSGAQLILEGPASLDVNSAWDATLRRGALKASVPHEAIGFRVSNPSVGVVDLGTEFAMVAAPAGTADVLVLKGEVEASPLTDADPDAILLSANESLHFAPSGVSDVNNGGKEFARFSQPLLLDHFAPALNYVHWSFDRIADGAIAAEVNGLAQPAFDARLEAIDPDHAATINPEGTRGRALRFDGKLYAKAAFRGISGSAAHTVAFWVRVPQDAQLSDHFTMVAWHTNLRQLRRRPVQINWNRNPNEGPIGVLRTDFGGGHAMGLTSLRDGHWHFITVFFAPGLDAAGPVQVKQYVDGRLESSTVALDNHHGPEGREDPALTDYVWMGCRIGNDGPMQDRFRGEIDELFIADRGLEPNEIVGLMKSNRPQAANVALAAR